MEEALFYVAETISNGWSRDILEMQIKSNLYLRLADKIAFTSPMLRILGSGCGRWVGYTGPKSTVRPVNFFKKQVNGTDKLLMRGIGISFGFYDAENVVE